MPPAMQIVHRLNREKDHEVDFGGVLGLGQPQILLAAPIDNRFEELIDRVLITVGKARDGAAHVAPNPPDESRAPFSG